MLETNIEKVNRWIVALGESRNPLSRFIAEKRLEMCEKQLVGSLALAGECTLEWYLNQEHQSDPHMVSLKEKGVPYIIIKQD